MMTVNQKQNSGMMIYEFKGFNKLKTRTTSGIVFIYNNRILLVHPSNEKWDKSMSYPKGKIEDGESIKDAAIRETNEEISINTPQHLLSNPYRIVSVDEEFNGIKKIDYYYVVYVDDNMFKEIFSSDPIIKDYKLQKEEIDWAGFMDKNQSLMKIKPRLSKVLYHIN